MAIEVLIILYGGWPGDEGSSDWGEVPPVIPVLIFSLVYHDLAPGELTETNFSKCFLLSFLSHQFVIDVCSCFGSSSVCLLGR